MNCFCTTLSSSLPKHEHGLIGRYELGSQRSPLLLYSGIILVCFHAVGNLMVSSDCWTITFHGRIINNKAAFSRFFKILSQLLFDLEHVLIVYATMSSVQYGLNRYSVCKVVFKYALTFVGTDKF